MHIWIDVCMYVYVVIPMLLEFCCVGIATQWARSFYSLALTLAPGSCLPNEAALDE